VQNHQSDEGVIHLRPIPIFDINNIEESKVFDFSYQEFLQRNND
jgi:hypothetical protein